MVSKTSLRITALLAGALLFAHDPERDAGRWWRGEWKEAFWDGPCEVKLESKRGEFKRETRCKDGVGADWGRPRKREFWDGPCKVKIEAKRDEYKEEVKCEGLEH